ncbi:MAG: hypothetical protein HGA45_35465, partial [Chloroflexales bacterium]|nr:hypothetical protein [Chloroflexales bacterium]
MQAWLYCTDSSERHLGEVIVSRLADQGVDLRLGDPATSYGTGVVLFGRLTGELCRMVQEWSAGGARRRWRRRSSGRLDSRLPARQERLQQRQAGLRPDLQD